jgi:hypothetical protein
MIPLHKIQIYKCKESYLLFTRCVFTLSRIVEFFISKFKIHKEKKKCYLTSGLLWFYLYVTLFKMDFSFLFLEGYFKFGYDSYMIREHISCEHPKFISRYLNTYNLNLEEWYHGIMVSIKPGKTCHIKPLFCDIFWNTSSHFIFARYHYNSLAHLPHHAICLKMESFAHLQMMTVFEDKLQIFSFLARWCVVANVPQNNGTW